MADEKPAGKTFNFNLTGDEFFLYETVKTAFEEEREAEDAKVHEALNALPAEARALVAARLAPVKQKDLTHREVFVRGLTLALRTLEAEADEADEADAEE